MKENIRKEKKVNQNYKPKIPKKEQISFFEFFLVLFLFILIYYFFKYSEIDKILITAILALAGIAIEMASHIFTYFLAFIQSIPYIGPIITKIITWPIFITLNVIAYFVSLIIIRVKGITLVKDAKVLTTIFIIGLLFGFILGRLF